jgi:hypothetical protein
MKKKVLLTILAAVLLLAVLFTPLPKRPYTDGGTREYCALTYKIVNWNRLTTDGVYNATKAYWFPNNFRSIDDLWADEEQEVVHKFVATVLELNGNSALVQPVAREDELQSSSKISVNTANLGDIGAEVGSDVEIYYTGGIMETYPAQINAIKWTLADDLRHREYTGPWLDPETATGPGYDPVSDIIITRIYSNCFFARAVIPMPYEIKVNGQLSEEWCVGDQVSCTYENTYRDDQNSKIETDLVTIKPSDFELDPNACYKPVIYLYPETETEVSVKLQLDGKLTCTYPAYNTGWNITAAPDGTLTDGNGQTYNYLYWEGETAAVWDMSKGFCVKGEDTAAFLEDALAKLGLNRKEANEFIVYWLPLMEQNPYNIISFQTDVYTNAAQLQVEPAPDTLIRVFMAWRAADAFTALEEQELTAPERTGFTVVEWGGTAVT